MVVSSDPEAREEKIGWKATQVMGARWDCSVCIAGECGSQVVGSALRREREDVAVAVVSSCWRVLLLDSRSKIFFWRRTTEVHFFSKRPEYFFRVVSSRVASICKSSRRAAALFERLRVVR